jgi:hypothetical protein
MGTTKLSPSCIIKSWGEPTSSEEGFLNIVWPLKKERTLSKRSTYSMRSTMLGNPSSDEVGKSYRLRNEMRFWPREPHRLVQCPRFLLAEDEENAGISKI